LAERGQRKGKRQHNGTTKEPYCKVFIVCIHS
jgi:hypothetical protein